MGRLAPGLVAVALAGCASVPARTASTAPTTPTASATPTSTSISISTPSSPAELDVEPARHEIPAADPLAPLRALVRASAARRVGHPFRGDCSGFVLRAYRDAGVRVEMRGRARSRSEALFRASVPVDSPRPGDLAFFHDTYDRNRDRRPGDRFTHVALVEAVDGSSVVLVHRGTRGVERLRMDLSRPSDRGANDRLRVERPADAPGTRYLSGQLFAAYGQLLGGEFTQMLPASHSRDTPGRQASRR
jgi:hypothetical protein